jgi:hypothetical protein
MASLLAAAPAPPDHDYVTIPDPGWARAYPAWTITVKTVTTTHGSSRWLEAVQGGYTVRAPDAETLVRLMCDYDGGQRP